jgi:hypothetical protein
MIRSNIAPRFKRAITMPFFWAILTLALHVWPGGVDPARGQGTRKDDIVFNSRGVPLAGATVRVCTMPASGQPCTPLALIYSDSALTQAIANPTTTDGLGNYFFYAASGTYEIEISGPGITTKQLPDVILPNNPASPTFSGAVSAFSMNLSGNLSVTGNTTVIGSLASGTLNLSNQSSPLGAAGAGTVNLYTKTADKRLYYKDETGTEIGPIASASGAQTNIINTFTATQNFDADVETKGPNPNFSLSRYGGYNSTTGTPPSTTGSITSGSPTLTLASAQDFANGQGIVVWKAGVLPAVNSVTTPGTPTVTPTNLINGATTYSYRLIAEDRQGGLTAAGTAGSTTTGAATLGANIVTLTNCTRTSGLATYTSSAPHNLTAGTQIDIEGFGSFSFCNGVKTIAATPTGSTFTANDGPLADENNSSGTPQATVFACNVLTSPNGSFSGTNTIRYWVYRNNALAGVAQGMDPWFMDCGYAAPNAPGYVPGTPPGAAQPGYLATTINSGGGTTTLTLANAAGTTASAQTVLHDNSVPLKNAVQAAVNSIGGTVYIPSGGSTAPFWVFNSTLDFSTISTTSSVRVHLNSSNVWLNQPWIPHGAMEFEGEPRATTSFQYVQTSEIEGFAYPFFILSESSFSSSVRFSRLFLADNQSQQTAILTDSGPDGGGIVGLTLDDVSAGGNGQGNVLIFKGGFDYFLNRGVCSTGTSGFVPLPCLQFSDASPAVTATNPPQVPGIVRLKGMYFSGNAMEIDCPGTNNVAVNDMQFEGSLFESLSAPYLRFNCPGLFQAISFKEVVTADNRVGFGTPVIDSQNTTSLFGVSWEGGALSNSFSPFLIKTVNSNTGALLLNGPFSNVGNSTTTLVSGLGIATNGTLTLSGTGRAEFGMTTSAAPSVSVSAGGNVAVGANQFQVQWLDVDGNANGLSPIAIATTTTGNQTVTLTPPAPPPGAVGYLPFVGGVEAQHTPCHQAIPAGTNYVDTFNFACGTSPAPNTAGATIFGPNGLSGQQLRLTNNGNVVTTNFGPGLTAPRTLYIPDVSGYNEVSSYLNSSYDNFNRANGAIGSNWTLEQNGFNVSSNQIVGSTGGASNTAFWNSNAFAPGQFAQVTITSLNGTTDFPGVTVLASGSGGSSTYYDCVENSTNIFMQRVVSATTTNLTNAASTGTPGDVLRLEVTPSGALTCYKNGVSTLTQTDTTVTSGAPGLIVSGNVATMDNWSGGNLHPLAHLDAEQDWTKTQHFQGNGGTCAMSSGTTCTITVTQPPTQSLPHCVATVQGTTPIAAACSISGTTLTITAASSNSATWAAFIF